MRTTEKIRRSAFWATDRLKGGQVNGHYNEIKDILENPDSKENVQLRADYLDKLLKHAVESTPYYFGCKSFKSINDFPIINKSIIIGNYDAFTCGDRNFKEGRMVVTSGSTGTPFTVKHGKRKTQRNTADTIYFGELAGFTIGQRLYYFKIWNKINKKNKFAQFMQNIVPYDVSELDDKSLSLIIDRLEKDRSNKCLLAYSSVYDALSAYMQKHNLEIMKNVVSIISMSEALDCSTRQCISHFFNVRAVSRYSNMENGIIAQQLRDGSDEFLINDASYFIELLDMNYDKPAPPGSPGRIVITDLFNYCMPLIRYDTGDIGVLSQKEIDGCIRMVFKSIEGRRMDMIYNTSGSLVSSYIVTNNMWKYSEIRQYQFIQDSANQYVFKLNTDVPFLRENELSEEFKKYLGEDAQISIDYVNEIPILASGKRRKVVNNFNQS